MLVFGIVVCPFALTRIYFIFQAVTAPMSSLNAITIEAYKKYVLVSLIQNGQVYHFLAICTA